MARCWTTFLQALRRESTHKTKLFLIKNYQSSRLEGLISQLISVYGMQLISKRKKWTTHIPLIYKMWQQMKTSRFQAQTSLLDLSSNFNSSWKTSSRERCHYRNQRSFIRTQVKTPLKIKTHLQSLEDSRSQSTIQHLSRLSFKNSIQWWKVKDTVMWILGMQHQGAIMKSIDIDKLRHLLWLFK